MNPVTTPGGSAMDAAAVGAEMEKLLATKRFVQTKTLGDLLRCLVENALSGDPPLDESALAAKVFGRGNNFVPQVDPIVRVQYRRLKAALTEYYEAKGRLGPVMLATAEEGFGIVALDRAAVAAQLRKQKPTKFLAAVVVLALAAGVALWLRYQPRREATRTAQQIETQGRELLTVESPSNAANSARLFEQAVAVDAGYAPAWSGLASALIVPGSSTELSRSAALAKAQDAAGKALKLDPTMGPPHAVLAYVKLFQNHDWAGAEPEFRKAIELDPSSPKTHRLYAQGLMSQGRFDDAITQSKLAASLQPAGRYQPGDLAEILAAAGRNDEAIAQARDELKRSNGSSSAHLSLGITLESAGKYDEAIEELQAAIMQGHSLYAMARLGYAYGAKGDKVAAESIYERMTHSFTQMLTIDWSYRAFVYAGLGDTQHALDCLQNAIANHEGDVLFMGVDPAFVHLRSDPRFAALKKQVGLP